jgi:hypothetical protein
LLGIKGALERQFALAVQIVEKRLEEHPGLRRVSECEPLDPVRQTSELQNALNIVRCRSTSPRIAASSLVAV